MSRTQQEITARACQLYLQGHSQLDIARTLGVSENTVSSWKKKEQWPVRPKVAADAALHKAAFQLFREGKSQQQIAQQIGVSENTIWSWKKGQHWVARIALLKDKALEDALTQIRKVVLAEVARCHACQQPRSAEALQRALAYVCQRLDRGEPVEDAD